jgi:hypothetical protein
VDFPFTWLDTLILTADCSVSLIWTHQFWLLIFVFDMGHTVGVTGRQVMLTPWHLILPLVCSIFWLCISYEIYETDHCLLYYPFILMEKRWQFGVIDGHIHKLNIIINLKLWNFNQEVHAGQTSEYKIEIATDLKGYKQEAQGPHRSPESYWLIFRLWTHATLLFFIAIRLHCQ